ncbi:MAG: hypothetical protein ACREF1_16680 [Acetobacteraceae bacterium]
MTAAPLLPLDVLLKVMRQKCDAKDWEGAAKLALIAAPYLHGRSATARDISAIDLQQLSDAELDRLIEAPDEDDEGGAAG